MIRILQIYDHIGINCGIMSVIMNWYRHIDTNEIQFDFLVSEKKEISYETEIKKLGGKIYYMSESLSVSNLYKIIKNVKKFMKKNAKEYSAVHLHTHTFAYPYLYYAKKYGLMNRISHAHSTMLGNTGLSNYRNRLMVFPLRFLANKYLACSDSAGTSLYNMIGVKKFDTVLNGIDIKKYLYNSEKRLQIRQQLGISSDEIVVIHVSNMTPIKNVPYVIEVFSKMNLKKKCKLILVGRNELPNDVLDSIQAYNVKENVLNLGIRSDLSDYLQAADVCLMPSEYEGLGLVVIECQASNLPVLTSLGFPDDVYVTEIIKKCDFQSDIWAEEAIKLASKRTETVDLSKITDKFDINVVTQKIIQYYKE